VHRGIWKLPAQGRATRNLTLGASVTALEATAAKYGRSVISKDERVGNVPKPEVRCLYGSYALAADAGI
jgi:hypothetical protein